MQNVEYAGGSQQSETTENRNLKRVTLLATSTSYVLVILDTSIVNVALDSISMGLATDVTGLQWVVTSYIVVFASLVLSGGALGDTYGARSVYLTGLVLFTLASLISGCAPSLPVLIAGRILQGVGAALLVPNALSLITHAYTEETERAKAIASWASAGGVAQIIGPLAGGMLIMAFDWRGIFFVNIPICLAGMWLALRIKPKAGDRGSRRLDLPGQLSAALAMILLVTSLIERELSWNNSWVFGVIALLAISFVIVEHRSKSPMLPLAIFGNPVFSWISLAILLGSAVYFGILFVLNLYFLRGAGYSPLETGLAMLPLALFATLGNIASARLARTTAPMTMMIAGASLRLLGFAGIAIASTSYSYPLIAFLFVVVGFGAGLSNPMTISVMLSATDKKYAGVTSGVATATGQLGAAIGVAIFGAFLSDADRIASGTSTAATISTLTTAAIITIVYCLRRRRQRAQLAG